ncbi:serine hydrolase domain-containing protein [Photorhabdus heterorhabditis]|uniref:serine hydrolase domain-containing protein n=1 Tax=Photorhabdus heterorhabditis TaxID=880156 RepID=UPI001BD27DE8|nr:serine hydrolase [Photorhabdus heterorhabditis]MBS9441006.1 class C beta-lactamase-related serine hydrolase [Photorhabdus heterorhabditis]
MLLNIDFDNALQGFLYPNIHALLVSQNDQIVLEKYFSGEDECWGEKNGKVTFDKDKLHDVRSITKGILAILYGAAIEYHQAPKLQDRLINVYPEYRENNSYNGLKVEHIITMTSGMDWNENYPYDDIKNDEIAMEHSPDRYHYIFSKPVISIPGKRWNYSGGCSALLGGIIDRTSGHTLSNFGDKTLFTKLGINQFHWYKGRDGIDSAASGLRLTGRGVLKIGRLMLNKGRYNGIDIIPSAWIEEILKVRVKTDDSDYKCYGYHWFIGGYYSCQLNKYFKWFSAIGNGGQVLLICPELDAVVVIFSGEYNKDSIWDDIKKLLDNCIFPLLSARYFK